MATVTFMNIQIFSKNILKTYLNLRLRLKKLNSDKGTLELTTFMQYLTYSQRIKYPFDVCKALVQNSKLAQNCQCAQINFNIFTRNCSSGADVLVLNLCNFYYEKYFSVTRPRPKNIESKTTVHDSTLVVPTYRARTHNAPCPSTFGCRLPGYDERATSCIYVRFRKARTRSLTDVERGWNLYININIIYIIG